MLKKLFIKDVYARAHWEVDCWFRREILKEGKMQAGDLVTVQIGWWPSFAVFPHRTVSNKWIWGRCYKRIVWRYTGFTDEPFTEYGNAFDILVHTEQ